MDEGQQVLTLNSVRKQWSN